LGFLGGIKLASVQISICVSEGGYALVARSSGGVKGDTTIHFNSFASWEIVGGIFGKTEPESVTALCWMMLQRNMAVEFRPRSRCVEINLLILRDLSGVSLRTTNQKAFGVLDGMFADLFRLLMVYDSSCCRYSSEGAMNCSL